MTTHYSHFERTLGIYQQSCLLRKYDLPVKVTMYSQLLGYAVVVIAVVELICVAVSVATVAEVSSPVTDVVCRMVVVMNGVVED